MKTKCPYCGGYHKKLDLRDVEEINFKKKKIALILSFAFQAITIAVVCVALLSK